MGEPPLYLHISAPSKSILDAAINKVNDLINQELGPLVEDRSQFGRRPGGPPTRQKWPEAKLPINLESLRNFNVRAKTVGPGVCVLLGIIRNVLMYIGNVRQVHPG
jgi:hypothetical protein